MKKEKLRFLISKQKVSTKSRQMEEERVHTLLIRDLVT